MAGNPGKSGRGDGKWLASFLDTPPAFPLEGSMEYGKNLLVWGQSDQIHPAVAGLVRRGIVAIGHGGSGTGLSRERAWVIPQSRDEGRMHFAVAGNPHRGAQTGSRPEPQTGGRPAAMSVVVDAWMSVVLFYGEAHAVLISNVEKKSAFARGFGVIALPILAAGRLADWESAGRFAGFCAWTRRARRAAKA